MFMHRAKVGVLRFMPSAKLQQQTKGSASIILKLSYGIVKKEKECFKEHKVKNHIHQTCYVQNVLLIKDKELVSYIVVRHFWLQPWHWPLVVFNQQVEQCTKHCY